MTTKETLLYQGAESKIFLKENFVIKRRIKKSYRIEETDEKLRKLRTRSEARLMQKLQGKINVPKLIKVNELEKEIIMQYIEGKKLSDYLDNFNLNKQLEIMKKIGEQTAILHDLNIIHSDLTTSNMILVDKSLKQKENNKKASQVVSDLPNISKLNNSEMPEHEEGMKRTNFKIFFIDFGLSFYSSRIEDKAVDLHLLKQALESKHFQNWQKLFETIKKGYNPKDKEKILKQLAKVEKRGRYKG
jgi:Kae1-associated kinase Bud32